MQAQFRAGDFVQNRSTGKEGTITCVIEKLDAVKYIVQTERKEIEWDESEVRFLRIGE